MKVLVENWVSTRYRFKDYCLEFSSTYLFHGSLCSEQEDWVRFTEVLNSFKVLSSQSKWTNGVLAQTGFHRFRFMALYSYLVTEYVGLGALAWAEFRGNRFVGSVN